MGGRLRRKCPDCGVEKVYLRKGAVCKRCAGERVLNGGDVSYKDTQNNLLIKINLRKAQSGRCRICGRNNAGNLVVDHHHTTEKVRALLCSSCNVGLGMFGDSIPRLKQAVEYLEQYGSYGEVEKS